MNRHLLFEFDSPEFFEEMGCIAKSFDYNVFMNAVVYCKFPLEKMEAQLMDINKRTEVIRRDYQRLYGYQSIFVNSFLTRNNELYSTTAQICRKIKRTIVGIRIVLEKYHTKLPQQRFRASNRSTKLSLMDYNFLSTSTYTYYMYDKEESGSEMLAEMYSAMTRYFDEWQRLVNLCKETNRRVEEVRQDPYYCNTLFKEYRDEWMRHHHASLEFLCTNDNIDQAPIIKVYNRCGGMTDACAQQIYHNYNESDGDLLMYKYIADKQKLNGMERAESLVFGDDRSLAKEARIIIDHFDEICPKGIQEKLNGKYIALFMMRYLNHIHCTDKQFINEFFYYYYSGSKNHISYNAINQQKGKITKSMQAEFDALIDKFLAKNRKGKTATPTWKQG